MGNFTITLEIKAPGIVKAIQMLGQAMVGGISTPTVESVPKIDTSNASDDTKNAKADTTSIETESEKAEFSSITIEEIRAEVKAKSKTHRSEIKDILKEYGATSVSTLAEEHYEAFYKKLGDL